MNRTRRGRCLLRIRLATPRSELPQQLPLRTWCSRRKPRTTVTRLVSRSPDPLGDWAGGSCPWEDPPDSLAALDMWNSGCRVSSRAMAEETEWVTCADSRCIGHRTCWTRLTSLATGSSPTPAGLGSLCAAMDIDPLEWCLAIAPRAVLVIGSLSETERFIYLFIYLWFLSLLYIEQRYTKR